MITRLTHRAVTATLLMVLLLSACAPQTSTLHTESSRPPATLKISSCNQAREAFLTGSKADQVKALKRLQKDKKADAVAREYARYWLGRDKADPKMRELDETLISSACAI